MPLKSPKKMLQTLAAIVVMGLLSACQNYMQDERRTLGEFTDDMGIQTAVKTALLRDKEVNGLAVNVDVSRSVVSLYGRVPSDYVRDKAVKLASAVRGVERVENHLTLVGE